MRLFSLLLLLVGIMPATAQNWYKGNLHTHSLWSDGDDYPEMIMDWYKDNGYHFVGLSDHNTFQEGEKWINVPRAPTSRRTFERYLRTFGPNWVQYKSGANDSLKVRLKNLSEYRSYFDEKGKFLIIKSEEVSTSYNSKPIHINMTNVQQLIRPQRGNSAVEVMQNNIDLVVAQRRQTGQPMFPHINHPNFYYSLTANDLMQLRHERFFEVFNGHPMVNNYGNDKNEGTETMWDKINTHFLQQSRPLMYGLATDDSHDYQFFGLEYSNTGRGWVMVNAPELSPRALIEALEAGRFYATTGVELEHLTQTATRIAFKIKAQSGVDYTIQFIGQKKGKSQVEILQEFKGTQADYTLAEDELMVRAKIISTQPKYNPYNANDVETAWIQPIAKLQTPPVKPNVIPLPNAHAHNDYEQSRPLWDALDHGFTSIEADVYLINDTLFVSHERPAFNNPAHTLEELYLKPLMARIQQNNNQVYEGYKGTFYLMIDFKTEAESTYKALEKLLQNYRSILTSYQGNKSKNGTVNVFISGNRPIETLKKSKERLTSLDGRPADLGQKLSPALMPVVSDNYANHLTWRGKDEMPEAQFQKLSQLVQKVHAEGKKLRLWACPEDPVVWKKLREAGADFISTDQLELVRDFLLEKH